MATPPAITCIPVSSAHGINVNGSNRLGAEVVPTRLVPITETSDPHCQTSLCKQSKS